MLIWSFAYVAALFGAISIHDAIKPTGPLLWLIAVLPALPILYFVWALGRYLVEETDELYPHAQPPPRSLQHSLPPACCWCWRRFGVFWKRSALPRTFLHGQRLPVWAIGLGLGHFYNKVQAYENRRGNQGRGSGSKRFLDENLAWRYGRLRIFRCGIGLQRCR